MKPTISSRVRTYLESHPKTNANQLVAKFNCSRPMAYRLLKEFKHPQRIKEIQTIIEASSLPPEPTSEPTPTPDPVNHPAHYTIGNIETIDFIEAKDLHLHHYLANAIKYISRAPYKEDYTQDIKKAIWYLKRELQLQEKLIKPLRPRP